MNLYLIQHGEPLAKDVDPERPLSAQGVGDVTKVAAFAAANCSGLKGCTVHHSGKLRAAQTAEIVAETLKLPVPEQVSGLKPMDDPAVIARWIVEREHDLILVGHLPFMSRLASLLLTGNAGRNIIRFRMGGIVALEKADDAWALQWQINPDIIPAG